ncbi:uncharacterized protein [Thunnus thynnus]|uniref:uncharacterized protein n=1 Tax=Thunnus thynnus TaxID=8237 RepID=UPI00352863B9
MSLTAATSGFLVFLLAVPAFLLNLIVGSDVLCVTVVQGQNDWRVTYTSTWICALKGSTVNIRCTYRYPSRVNDNDYTVEETFWFTKESNGVYVDLRTDPEYAGRVHYHSDKNDCTLTITDLRESDSAEYKFRFITNQPGGRVIGSPGVTLTVTDFQVKVSRGSACSIQTCTWAKLQCHTSCHLPDHASYIWYKNGENIWKQTSSFSGYFYPPDSYSCAVKGYEHHSAPSVCVSGQSCNRVIYTDQSICAFRGSSVDISCTYNSNEPITSKFWFNLERSHRWRYSSQPEDLSEDSQYAGHVQVIETERGRSTLRISDLRESDSAQYHFTFKTQWFEWRSSLPGTTLTVTEVDRVMLATL